MKMLEIDCCLATTIIFKTSLKWRINVKQQWGKFMNGVYWNLKVIATTHFQ